MFERRSTLKFILALNICALIWRIAVQIPEVDPSYDSLSVTTLHNNNTNNNNNTKVKVFIKNVANANVKMPNLNSISKMHRTGSTSQSKKNNCSNENILKKKTNSTRKKESNFKIKPPLILPVSDFQQLIDFNNFSYEISQPPCNSNIKALILVHSAPENIKKRSVIRQTWGSQFSSYRPFRIIFLLGKVNTQNLQIQLELENSVHSDILQGSFIDAYRNMTYKHVMAFKFYTYSCPNAQILIKVDDDVFVNTPLISQYISNKENPTSLNYSNNNINLFSENLLFCDKYSQSLVKRTYRSKWRVSFKEYSKRYYPPYCPGFAIIYSSDVVFRLYSAAQKHKYFWIDDVLITGVIASSINITITSMKPYILFQEEASRLSDGSSQYNDIKFIFAWPNIAPEDIFDLWRTYQQQNLLNFIIKNGTTNTYEPYRLS